MIDGIGLISGERIRQLTVEGWTPEHDDRHSQGQLAQAAACYAAESDKLYINRSPTSYPYLASIWPWSQEWWKPKSRLHNMIRAGALIAAEIDRLLRAGVMP